MSNPESFFRRWSRLKQGLASAPARIPPALPEAGSLDFGADFSPFMHPGVDGEVRREALRKLFMTDHYRVMDGLDVYVGDYSTPELLPAEALQSLQHAQSLLMPPEEPEKTAVATTARDSGAA
jgi:hypothetical protein